MKILHINTLDSGGAAIACIRLHRALLNAGIDSKLLTLEKTRDDVAEHYWYDNLKSELPASPEKSELAPSPVSPVALLACRLIRMLFKVQISMRTSRRDVAREAQREKQKAIERLLQGKECIPFIHTPYRITRLQLFQEADIVNLHWVARFVDWPSFFAESKDKILVWTLHDMSPFTGGYHYADGYKGYKENDVGYPPLADSIYSDLIHRVWEEKKQIFDQHKVSIQVVTLSRWLEGCSKQSSLFSRFSHTRIPNSVDMNAFKPLDKRFCREALSVPIDKNVALAVISNPKNRRKAHGVLLDSLKALKTRGLVLCSVGDPSKGPDPENVYHLSLGVIRDERLLCLAYNAADVCIVPSLEDNLPNVVLESVACGTPVLGFEVGGLPDMIRSGLNGFLSSDVSARGLGHLVDEFFNSGINLSAQKIRDDAVKRYSPSVQASGYINLYRKLQEKKNQASWQLAKN